MFPNLHNPSMRSNSDNRMSLVPSVNHPRSSFLNSYRHTLDFDGGFLIPFYHDEVLPGDTFHVDVTAFARMPDSLGQPVMDNAYIETFFFYIPNRIVWNNWEKFQGARDNPTDSTDFTIPQITPVNTTALRQGSYSDFFGIPPSSGNLPVNSLLFRSLMLTWNEWFRDENIQKSLVFSKGNSEDDEPDSDLSDIMFDNLRLLRRGKRHDYFTMALPFAQKGDPVSIGIGGTAPLSLSGTTAVQSPSTVEGQSSRVTVQTPNLSAGFRDMAVVEGSGVGLSSTTSTPNSGLYTGTQGLSGTADLSSATAITINQIRTAFQTQRLLERDARGGTRYFEILRSHWGVMSPDSRLQRPEYLGGGRGNVDFNLVPHTDTNAGDLNGFATAENHGHGFSGSFVEHGHIIGLACIFAELSYSQGIHRMWHRRNRLDFAMPVLAHIGEQAVLQKEIFATGTAADDNKAFGYVPRYEEYRTKTNRLSGAMRVDAAGTLSSWHLSQDFANAPTLSDTFIGERPPFDRIKRNANAKDFIVDFHFRERVARCLPAFGVPGYIDRA